MSLILSVRACVVLFGLTGVLSCHLANGQESPDSSLMWGAKYHFYENGQRQAAVEYFIQASPDTLYRVVLDNTIGEFMIFVVYDAISNTMSHISCRNGRCVHLFRGPVKPKSPDYEGMHVDTFKILYGNVTLDSIVISRADNPNARSFTLSDIVPNIHESALQYTFIDRLPYHVRYGSQEWVLQETIHVPWVLKSLISVLTDPTTTHMTGDELEEYVKRTTGLTIEDVWLMLEQQGIDLPTKNE